LNRKKLIYIAIAVVCSSLVVASALGYIGGAKRDSYNVVEIYILNWDINATGPGNEIDVQFRISIDGDGNYDLVGSSDVFHNTSVEIVPFRLGDTIQTTKGEFQFKIDVFRVVNGSLVPMRYLDIGPTPVSYGLNKVDSSNAWAYDATTGVEKDDMACRISYVYYVNSSS
jgi:hypothetical protein